MRRDSRGRMMSETKLREEAMERERRERIRHVQLTLASRGAQAVDMK